MNKILVDTNIYSSVLRGDQDVVQVLRQVIHIGISAVSIGELLSSFRGGNRKQENRKELGIFLDSPRVTLYTIDENTAEYYCLIINQLKKNETKTPASEIWIAAAAFQHGLTLYTLDKHFYNIEGLLLLAR